jgi:hypothetical protein
MPTNRVRRRQGRRSGYGDSQRVLMLLLTGCDFEFIDPSLGPRHQLDRELLAVAWRENHQQLLDWHLHGHGEGELIGNPQEGQPGSRPWGWWQFSDEVPEPRPRVMPTMENRNGFLVFPAGLDPLENWGRGEPELDYLIRCDLLTDEERKTLGEGKPCQ